MIDRHVSTLKGMIVVVSFLTKGSFYVSATAGPLFGDFCPSLMEPWLCNRFNGTYWIRENCDEDIDNSQLQALAAFYTQTGNTGDTGPLYEKGWLSDCDYCNWEDITCNDGGNVTAIESPENSPALTGSFPPAIFGLESLETLVLYSNEFSGEIPSELGLLTALTMLKLHYNNFEGDMPNEICSLEGGDDVYISADCGKPEPEVYCDALVCCDACYIDPI